MEPTLTLITAFEVPPDADDAFVETWERGRRGQTVLHRALRPDVDFRFLEVARVAGADSPGERMPFPAHAGVYEVAREDGTPDIDGGVVLIDPREAPDERFLAGWDRARAVHARQRGYLGARLYRSVGPADFPLVEIARWSSPLMVARALKAPEFRDAMPSPSHPALYLVVRG